MMSSKGKKRKSDRRLDERDLDYFDDGKLPPDHVRDNDDDGDGDAKDLFYESEDDLLTKKEKRKREDEAEQLAHEENLPPEKRETAEEKRTRLARLYLEKLRREVALEGDDEESDVDEDEDVDTADVFSERSAMSSGHGALSPASRQNSLGTAKSDDEDALGSAAEHIFQLAKLRTLLQSERDHSQSVIEKLKSELAMVKDTVMLERERRAQELKRALLEGVKFFCHTKNSKAALKADETYYLRYHGYKQIFTLHKKHGVKSKPVHTLNIAHVAFAAVGTKHFTMGVTREQDAKETTKAKSARAQEIHSLSASKCLTIVFSTEQELKAEAASIREAKELAKKVKCATGEAEEAEPVVDEPAAFASPGGLAGTGLVGLDLEIPLKGNGRSAREWVDGINALKQVYTATEYPELKYLENVRQKSLKKSADENRDMHKNGPPAVSPEKSKRTSEVVAEIKRTPTSFASVDE